jgi:hypothetical protein
MEAAVDPNALSKALMREFGDSGRSSDITPGGSPSRKRQRIYADRSELTFLCIRFFLRSRN